MSIYEQLGLPNPSDFQEEEPKANKKIQQYIDKAYYDAVYDTYKSIFKHQLAHNFATTGVLPYEASHPAMQATIEEARYRVTSKPHDVLLTVNPKPGVTLETLQKSVKTYINKKIIAKYEYVYEIRKAPDLGLHVHILLHYKGRPYDFKKATQKHFAGICDAKNPSILNLRYVKPEDMEDKQKYIRGHKQDKKLPGVKATIAWRLKNNIEQLYSTPLETEVSLVGVRTEDSISDVQLIKTI